MAAKIDWVDWDGTSTQVVGVNKLGAAQLNALGAEINGKASSAVPYDISIVAFGATTMRAPGTGDFPFGIKLQRPCTLTSVTYRCVTAGAGSLVVELRKNGTTVSGSSATITIANQITGGTATGTWAFASGDIITVQITAVGASPGTGLIADAKGTTPA